MKLSQWHDANVNPVHIGVYEVVSGSFTQYKCWSHWDGASFSGCWGTILQAYEKRSHYKKHESGCSRISKWRGIVKDKK